MMVQVLEEGTLVPAAVLSVVGLGRTYTAKNRPPKEAIREISFEAGLGELVCVVGPSGAGKTTLLRCLAGLLAPSKGTISFEGRPIEGTPAEVAVVFQDYSRSLFPWLTVASNIALPLKNKGMPKRERAKLVEEALAAVGLPEVGAYHPWQLSGGMQQRIAIARALAYQPKLLLMDEPFASVDAQTRFELEDLVLSVRERFGMTIVFVTHDIDEAVYVGDRIIVLSASPCVVKRDLAVPFGAARDQVTTRRDPRFGELRSEVLQLVMRRPDGPTASSRSSP
jgi:NitT/TauT family transport system ATP-binding protein